MKKYTIFDLDGCLSDDEHRRPLLPQHTHAKPSEYDAYNDKCSMDAPMNQQHWVRATLATLPMIITARPSSCNPETQDWIHEWFGGNFSLRMRPQGNLMPSPELKVMLLNNAGVQPHEVAEAYDDRADVLAAYREWGIPVERLFLMDVNGKRPFTKKRTVSEILHEMSATFAERNAIYGDNYKQVAKLVKVFFPNGVPPELVVTDQWHLFELKLVKLSRFAISNLTHMDSIHDDAVYSAMIESILSEEANNV